MTASEPSGRGRIVAEPTFMAGVADCRVLRWALVTAKAERVRKKGAVSDGFDELLEAVSAVAEVGDRAAWISRRSSSASPAPCEQQHGEDEEILDAIGTAEAAGLLGCSERQARRLANSGDLGPVTGTSGRKQVSRGAVIDHARRRAAASC